MEKIGSNEKTNRLDGLKVKQREKQLDFTEYNSTIVQ